MPSTWRPAALLLAFALPALPALPASAVMITVTTADDQDLADGFCSLREAILAANTDAARNECPAGAGEDQISRSTAWTSSGSSSSTPRLAAESSCSRI